MGTRKQTIKEILKNTFYRKNYGNLISQLKILIQNRAVFETSSTNISVPKIAYSNTTTCLNAQERQLSNDVGVSE
jgi:S-adenosylmethionine synthetase